MKKSIRKKKKKFDCMQLICWVIIPFAIIMMIILDGLRIYTFNTERLIIIGTCVFVMLIPFFKEITIKDFSLKKENDN